MRAKPVLAMGAASVVTAAFLLRGTLFGQALDGPGRVRPAAPDLAAESWLNTDKPLSIKDLKGQVVLLDFWTYCCINCMHVLPDLKYLEHKYRDRPFVVIGVHSGKFDQEKDAENIRQAVLRHNVAHPIAVDSQYRIWNAYGVDAWPTLVLIDPEGRVVGSVSGEGHRDLLDRYVSELLGEHAAKGTLGQPMKFRLERETFKPGALEFPGKVRADAERKRLFISDTNHHRVLVTDLDGRVREFIGSGAVGMTDGAFAKAAFHQPQGLALSADGRILYVADTGNHAVRAVDLEAGTVTTLAGTGQQSYERMVNGPGKTTALSSPWDLARVGSQLFIAMAGTHQIWVLDLDSGRVQTHAGTGRESRIDGPNARAAFAQPSGLASDGKVLYVADSEISTIRSVDVAADGQTRTVAGSGGLFDFGHRDGTGGQARFQHPLGVALDGRRLFVADTFNHRIRVIDLETGAVGTWLGTGKTDAGEENAVGLFEPGGLSVGGGTLYVADTNHHRIVAVDLETRKARVLNVAPATRPAP
jgi:DNA-binding beta-propeller fold protein YncE/cytochrome oxidase Cu insertion factor (SCO1/SenC/PrrC family)